MVSLANSTKQQKSKSFQFSAISLRKWKQREHFLNSLYEASDTQIPKPDKDITRKENYRPIPLMKMAEKSLRKYRTIKSKFV